MHPPLHPLGQVLEQLPPHPVEDDAFAITGMSANTIASKMGSIPFAVFLKNWRRDWSSSFLFCFMIIPSCPIGSPDWTDWFIKE